MHNLTIHMVFRGQYEPLEAGQRVGWITGDYATLFWAYDLRGRRLAQTFATPEQAGKALVSL